VVKRLLANRNRAADVDAQDHALGITALVSRRSIITSLPAPPPSPRNRGGYAITVELKNSNGNSNGDGNER